MHSLMSLKIYTLSESLLTHIAFERLFSRVCLHVTLQIGRAIACIRADVALVFLGVLPFHHLYLSWYEVEHKIK